MRYILFARYLTGAAEYGMVNEDRAFAIATKLVLPHSSLKFEIGNTAFSFKSFEDTVVPGVSNGVYDSSEQLVYKIVLKNCDVHELQMWGKTVTITDCCDAAEPELSCSCEGKWIATLKKIPGYHSDECEWHAVYEMHSEEELSDELATILLGFPLMRIAPYRW